MQSTPFTPSLFPLLTLLAMTSVLLPITTQPVHADQPESSRDLRVLIVDGFSNHDWQAGTRMLVRVLQQDPCIHSTVSTVPDQPGDTWEAWSPEFSAFDVVIQNCNDIGNGRSWPAPAQRGLEQYVRNGGAMLIFHSANNAFPAWEEYNKMIGLGWRSKDFGVAIRIEDGVPIRIPAGEGGNTSHGKRVDARITRLGDHPIHRGLPRHWLAADLEVYRYARGPAEHLTVLSYANDAKTGIDFPIEWTVRYGEGRVYNSTFGHYWHNESEDPPGVRCVGFQTLLLRAVRWLAGAEFPPGPPEQFPSPDHISLSEATPPE